MPTNDPNSILNCFTFLSDYDDEARFNNGKISAEVFYYSDTMELVIHHWKALSKRSGHSRSTLTDLRPHFTRIEAIAVDDNDHNAINFWSQMVKEGLIDSFCTNNSIIYEHENIIQKKPKP